MTSIHRLQLTDVTPAPHLPWARPTFPVFAYLVLHPAGPILIDTGVGIENSFIDELYSPVHYDLNEALTHHGVAVNQIGTVITSHLHFDHCGQNHRFPDAQVFVQQAEAEAATAPLYTVPEWAFPANIDLTVIEGDHEIASGVRIILAECTYSGWLNVVALPTYSARRRPCSLWTASRIRRAAATGDRPLTAIPSRSVLGRGQHGTSPAPSFTGVWRAVWPLHTNRLRTALRLPTNPAVQIAEARSANLRGRARPRGLGVEIAHIMRRGGCGDLPSGRSIETYPELRSPRGRHENDN